ncbi:Cro/CI family transcriptional regulator [Pseudogulbenkiania sp. NH8B]|uniref:Cro/CI family transcriptional regulator n=1 Tax=Pseudogulbenkiania sp. (strain NH8B) TaxID=748280 RepID=UPI0011D1CB82|nr:Cro/CI family transcriptional regulator [Pseudogulbenkiania sp. NH8B]
MDDKDIIENLGGVKRVSTVCGISPSAVSQWKASNSIPRGWKMFFLAAFPAECGLPAAPDFRSGLTITPPTHAPTT